MKIAMAVLLSLFPTTCLGKACLVFEENQVLELKGKVKKSLTLDNGEGNTGVRVVEMKLDSPICFRSADQEETWVAVLPTAYAKQFLGKHVQVIGNMVAGDGWSVAAHSITPILSDR